MEDLAVSHLHAFDASRSEAAVEWRRGHCGSLAPCVFSRDGQTLVNGSDDRTTRFWNLATFREVAAIQLTYAPYFLAFSADGMMLAANNGGGALRRWRAPTPAEIDVAEAKEKAESKQS